MTYSVHYGTWYSVGDMKIMFQFLLGGGGGGSLIIRSPLLKKPNYILCLSCSWCFIMWLILIASYDQLSQEFHGNL